MKDNKLEITIEISNYYDLIEKLEKIKNLLQEINDIKLNAEVK